MLPAMIRHVSITAIACALVLPLLATPGCLDPAAETGYYSAPCSGSFYDILLCARDTGAAPPRAEVLVIGTSEPRFTCANACQRSIDCGYIDPEDDDACTSSCLMDAAFDQEVLDCIRDNECDIGQCYTDL